MVIAPVSRTNLRQRQLLTPTNSAPSTPGTPRHGHGVARSASLRAAGKTANRNHAQPSPSAFGFQPVVKPAVVKPSVGPGPRGYRREPEGIEHGAEEAAAVASKMSASMITPRGSYDHSAEYDPYQSAADQMQELLFGASPSLIKPSSNSAFQKYVPSTSDINTKMNACKQPAGGNMFSSMHEHHSAAGGGHHGYGHTPNRVNFVGRTNGGSNGRGGGASGVGNDAKVARFCHECGNPFALPSIRFCCECGVKRLYC